MLNETTFSVFVLQKKKKEIKLSVGNLVSPTLVRYGLGGLVTLKTHYVFICYGFCVCVWGGSFNLNALASGTY